MKIEKREYKTLVEREEIYAFNESDVTPSKSSIQEEISALVKKPKEQIVVKKIDQKYGSHESKILVYVYDSLDSLKKFELVNRRNKEKKAGEAAPEQAAQAAQAAAPAKTPEKK
jgi:ribosomal protein S24E